MCSRRLSSLNLLVYELSNQLYSTLSQQDRSVDPLLIVDQVVTASPRRLFLVRYIIGEAGSGESKRPIFKNELTGIDYEMKITYATQTERLEGLQQTMEAYMYAPSNAKLSKVVVRNLTSSEEIQVKVIISEELVSKLVDLYEYAW
jgi:hypothetical protein